MRKNKFTDQNLIWNPQLGPKMIMLKIFFNGFS